MGSEISQSQQLRNTFPLSQYMMLPSDKNYPDLTFIQRLSDNAIFAACAIDKSKQTYQKSKDKHIIKRVQRRQIGKKIFQLYQWATANVQGLVQYINLVDKNRKISKTQYKSIVQGSIKGLNSLSKQSFEIQCLQIDMSNLRIFNQVQLKINDNNSKQIVNSIVVKMLPKNLISYFKPQNQMKWKSVGQCIHQGGVLTERQLLGEYLLQLANYSTKFQSKNRNQSLNNLKSNFGLKTLKVIQSLLSSQQWKNVVKVLNQQQVAQTQQKDKSPLKQISNIKKNDGAEMLQLLKDYKNNDQKNLKLKDNTNKQIQTQKTIDTVGKNTSEKILFKAFRPEEQQQQQYQHCNNDIRNYHQLDLRNRVSSGYQFQPVSPGRQNKYFSPPSIKLIQQVTPPKISKQPQYFNNNNFNNEDFLNLNNTKLTRTNSILTIFPDFFREQGQIQQRQRVLSARNIRPQQQYFSPDERNINSKYVIHSPKMTKDHYNQAQISNNASRNNLANNQNHANQQSQINYRNTQIHHKKQHNQLRAALNQQTKPSTGIQKRKSKNFQLKLSKPNNTLSHVNIADYVIKIKPDVIQNRKLLQNQFKNQFNQRGQSFLSQQFNGLDFSLQEKYFSVQDHNLSKNVLNNQQKAHKMANNKPKVELKAPNMNLANQQYIKPNNQLTQQNNQHNNNHNNQLNSINNNPNPINIHHPNPINYHQTSANNTNHKSDTNSFNNRINNCNSPRNNINNNNINNNNKLFLSPQQYGKQNGHQANSPYQKLDIKQANSQTLLVQAPQKYISSNHNPYYYMGVNQSKPQQKPQIVKPHQQFSNQQQHQYQNYTTNNNTNNNNHSYNSANNNYKQQTKQQPTIKQPQQKQEQLKQSKYIGPINIKGQKQGQGKLYFPSGGSYIGEFFKDFMHGRGKLYYPSSKLAYQGNFKYDKFHGSGKLYNQNPTYIQAFDFRNFNKLQVTEKQQPIHKQHMLINAIQKQKKISYWKYYEGEMNYDMKHGKGTLVLENGEKFEGQFKDDLVNGLGIFYGQNGKISGKWEDNLLVQIYR